MRMMIKRKKNEIKYKINYKNINIFLYKKKLNSINSKNNKMLI